MTDSKVEKKKLPNFEGEVKKVSIKEVKPYWRNPRQNMAAIEKAKQSIKTFGYQQFISVDKDLVIIAGHTRYKALLELGYDEISVIVANGLTDKQAKEYRIVDNAVNTWSTWSDDLALELKEIDMGEMQQYFEEDLSELINKSMGIDAAPVTENDIKNTEGRLDDKFGDLANEYKQSEKEVICPKCAHVFFIR